MRVILLKNPSGQKVTVKKTISDVSPGNSNRVQTKLARKNSRQFSCIFTHLQKRGVLQQNRECHIEHCRSSRLPSAQAGGTRGLGKNMTISIRLKNPSGQQVTVKKTISDVSPGNSNRVQTKLARKNSRHFSCIFTHLQKRGVLQQNQSH